MTFQGLNNFLLDYMYPGVFTFQTLVSDTFGHWCCTRLSIVAFLVSVHVANDDADNRGVHTNNCGSIGGWIVHADNCGGGNPPGFLAG